MSEHPTSEERYAAAAEQGRPPAAPVDIPAPAPTGEDATAPITIEVSITLDLDPDEVWPDRDWPTGWTAKDVLRLVKDSGSPERFLSSWAPGLEADVTVRARGSYENGHLR